MPPLFDPIIQGLAIMIRAHYTRLTLCTLLLVATSSSAQEVEVSPPTEPAAPAEVSPPHPGELRRDVPLPAAKAQPTPSPSATPPQAPKDRMVRVTHRDGRISEGKLLEMSPYAVLMRVGAGRLLSVPVSEVISVETWPQGDAPPPIHQIRHPRPPTSYHVNSAPRAPRANRHGHDIEDRHDRKTWRPDPNRTRYLFAPSAYTLDVGEGYFSQKQLGLSEVAFAVHDDVTLLVGGVIPTWFMEEGFNLVMGMKAGLQIADNLHWAAGVYGVLVPPTLIADADVFGGGGIAFTTLTWGSEHFHGSFSVGMPFVYQDNDLFYDPVLVLAGNFRVSPGLALVTEHWVIPSLLAQDFDSLAGLVNTAALRFVGTFAGKEWGVDLGLVRVHGLDIPVLPWLDVTYNWGT